MQQRKERAYIYFIWDSSESEAIDWHIPRDMLQPSTYLEMLFAFPAEQVLVLRHV